MVRGAISTLAAPDNLDQHANMLTNEAGLHTVRDTIRHAARQVSQDRPDILKLAGRMIDAAITYQENGI